MWLSAPCRYSWVKSRQESDNYSPTRTEAWLVRVGMLPGTWRRLRGCTYSQSCQECADSDDTMEAALRRQHAAAGVGTQHLRAHTDRPLRACALEHAALPILWMGPGSTAGLGGSSTTARCGRSRHRCARDPRHPTPSPMCMCAASCMHVMAEVRLPFTDFAGTTDVITADDDPSAAADPAAAVVDVVVAATASAAVAVTGPCVRACAGVFMDPGPPRWRPTDAPIRMRVRGWHRCWDQCRSVPGICGRSAWWAVSVRWAVSTFGCPGRRALMYRTRCAVCMSS